MFNMDRLSESNHKRIFWFLTFLLILLAVVSLSHDLTRPFIGLHSWGQAHDAWVARSHVNYGLGYTKGFDTFAVGEPPAENPTRYLDHPVLFTLINAFFMKIIGVNSYALRVENILATVVALVLFLIIVRGLTNNVTALLSGFFFCIFPLIGYFGVNQWHYPLAFLAFWSYLVIIGAFKDGPEAKSWHRWVLAGAIFFDIQMTWEGFFFAMAIGFHYVFRCLHRKQWPDKGLLTVLIVAPFSSVILNFAILAAGENWDFERIWKLAKIRATSGEAGSLTWGQWSGHFWRHAKTNFTVAVMVIAAVTVTLGQIYSIAVSGSARAKSKKDKKKSQVKVSRVTTRYPQFWLFLMPAIFQLLILKGTLAPHQYWERPLVPFLAIAMAVAMMILYDIVRRVNRYAAVVAVVAAVGALSYFCVEGTKYYYSVRWQRRVKIEMFEDLNKQIPGDKALLSYDPLTINQFPGVKAASYRPEIAWYLDRDIVQAGKMDKNLRIKPVESFKQIESFAATGKYPYYLVQEDVPWSKPSSYLANELRKMGPNSPNRARFERLFQQERGKDAQTWRQFLGLLEGRYKIYKTVKGVSGGMMPDGKFWKVSTPTYLIFDLSGKSDGSDNSQSGQG